MNLLSRKSALWLVVVCALSAILVTLGVLQYRWSKEVSEAATTRMRADLIRSMIDFRLDFLRELASVPRTLESVDTSSDFNSYARAFANWQRSASHPGIVKDVYIWQQGPGHSQLLKIKSPGEGIERVEWPPELTQLRDTAATTLPVSKFLLRAPSPLPPPPEHRPPESGELSVAVGVSPDMVTSVQDIPFAVAQGNISVAGRAAVRRSGNGGGVNIQHQPIANDGQKFVIQFRQPGKVTLNHSPWMVIPSIPGLVQPLLLPSTAVKGSGHGCRAGCATWMIVLLSQAFLAEHLLPELAARHFSGIDYEIAVVAGQKGDRTIYSSNPEAVRRSIAEADASMSLFSPPGFPHTGAVGLAALPRLKGVTSTIKYGGVQPILEDEEAMMEIPPMPGVLTLDGWQLVVNNRRGSLEAAVAALRRRQLAISFGVLVVLAATMGIIILATKRVQEVARMQMDFVAGVSHELRTPLTVISSAADNIADGLVGSREQMAHYGTALKGQAGQLRELVEQILLFAATRDNRQKYSLRVAQVGDALDLALQNTAELIRGAGVAVQCHVSPDLPDVLIDVQAFSRCLQNLITNAIKYGGDAGWIGIKAKTEEYGREVVVAVRDRGIGIPPEEMNHIFEPFYRGTSVREAQIHGSGLGLPVAMSIVEMMGGRITVESEPGRGSSFTVRLPSANAVAA